MVYLARLNLYSDGLGTFADALFFSFGSWVTFLLLPKYARKLEAMASSHNSDIDNLMTFLNLHNVNKGKANEISCTKKKSSIKIRLKKCWI